MRRILTTIDNVLAVVETVVIATLVIVALALGVTQVILRYVFNSGFSQSEALFVLATIAGMLFAGSRAVRDDKHVSVDLVPLLLPPGPRRMLHLIAHGVTLALTAYFAYCGLVYVQFVHSMDTVSPDTGLPDWLVYSLVPLTMGAFALRYIIRIYRLLHGEDIVAPKLPDTLLPTPGTAP